MIYKYFVSYIDLETPYGYGYGRIQIITDKKIKTMQDIQEIEEILVQRHGHKKPIVNNYILLNKKIGTLNGERRETSVKSKKNILRKIKKLFKKKNKD